MAKINIILLTLAVYIINSVNTNAQKQDKIDILIQKRKYEKAEEYCIKQSGAYQMQCYSVLANAILTYRNDYQKAQDYYRKAGKSDEVNLRFALNDFNLAQSATDDSIQQRLYLKADALFRTANYVDFMLETFKYPTKNVHLEKMSGSARLSESIKTPHSTRLYLYGGTKSIWFNYDPTDENINRCIPYSIMLASSNGAKVGIVLYLLRDGIYSTLGRKIYTIKSEIKSDKIFFKSYIGFFLLDEKFKCLPNDKLGFQISGSGNDSDYILRYANFLSWVKLAESNDTLNSNILDEREKAVSWVVTNNKWSHPSDVVLNFIAQLDHCVLNEVNATWNMGSNFQKDGLPYQVNWISNHLTIEQLTKENADSLGIEEDTFIFRQE